MLEASAVGPAEGRRLAPWPGPGAARCAYWLALGLGARACWPWPQQCPI